jgi:hypothetical protein
MVFIFFPSARSRLMSLINSEDIGFTIPICYGQKIEKNLSIVKKENFKVKIEFALWANYPHFSF